MTLSALTYPLILDAALIELRDALGDNYGATTDDPTLTRALARDAVTVGAVVHARPWATAARLIKWNTEYELDYKLKARIDRKIADLLGIQAEHDAAAGITDLIPGAGSAGLPEGWPTSGNVPNEAVF